jgi:hypothetical protein
MFECCELLQNCILELSAEYAEQSVLSRVAWQDATSDACVMEPALQHPRPVVSQCPPILPPCFCCCHPRPTQWTDCRCSAAASQRSSININTIRAPRAAAAAGRRRAAVGSQCAGRND